MQRLISYNIIQIIIDQSIIWKSIFIKLFKFFKQKLKSKIQKSKVITDLIMSSLGTRIAIVVASAELSEASQMVSIKSFLTKWSGIRVQYRGKERRSGEMVHIFNLYIPPKTEARYSELFAYIGDKFYQGNRFVIYKWEQRILPTEAPTPVSTTSVQTRKAIDRIGYNVTSTWGVPSPSELDPSIQVLRYERRKE